MMKFKSNAKYGQPVESGSIYKGEIGNMRITVHRIIRCDGWYLTCHDVQISQRKLKSDTLMGAIEESKTVLKNTAQKMMDDVNAFCEEDIEISRY